MAKRSFRELMRNRREGVSRTRAALACLHVGMTPLPSRARDRLAARSANLALMRRIILALALLLVWTTAAAQPRAFRDLNLGDSCETVVQRLRGYEDIRILRLSDAELIDCKKFSSLEAELASLFNQANVAASFLLESEGGSLESVTFSVSSDEGETFALAAIEGFTAVRGEPDYSSRLRVGYVPNRSKPGLRIEAGWIGDGVRLEVSAFRYDYGAVSDGSIDIRRAPRFNTLEDDAKQF